MRGTAARVKKDMKTAGSGWFFLVVISLLSALSCPSESWSEYYRYTDSQGTESYTDSIDGVPQEFRKKAVRVGEGGEETARPLGKDKAPDQPAASRPSSVEETPSLSEEETTSGFLPSGIIVEYALIVVAAVTAFITIGRWGSNLVGRQVAFILKLSLLFGVGIYLLQSEIDRVNAAFAIVKEEVLKIKEMKEGRENNANAGNYEAAPSPSPDSVPDAVLLRENRSSSAPAKPND